MRGEDQQPDAGPEEPAGRPRKRRRLPFNLDLIPGLRSWRWAESQTDWEKFEWNRALGEELPWRARLLFGAAWFFLREAGRDVPIAGRIGPAAAPDGGGMAGGLGRELESEVGAVKRVVSQFVAADSVAGRGRFVLPTPDLERKMEDYYARHPARAGVVYDFPIIALQMPAGGNHYIVRALTSGGEQLDFIVVPGVDGGDPKIAWEAHVGYGETDWEESIEARPPDAVEMRAYIELADYYVPPYERRTGLLSVKLTHPKSARVLYGFVSKIETRGVEGLAAVLLGGGRKPVTLKISFPAILQVGEQPLVLVAEFVCAGWFVSG